MVIANPTLVTNVSAVPFDSVGAVCATSAENWGESDITVIPHITMNTRNGTMLMGMIHPESRQHTPDITNE